MSPRSGHFGLLTINETAASVAASQWLEITSHTMAFNDNHKVYYFDRLDLYKQTVCRMIRRSGQIPDLAQIHLG